MLPPPLILAGSLQLWKRPTYVIEGDGELITRAYTHQEISTAAALENYPHALATAQEIAAGDAAEVQELMVEAKACIN